MKRVVPFFVALIIAAGAAAQLPARPPEIGPNDASARRDLWQILTPEQREQLWLLLTPEQKYDVWRGLDPRERRDMRERLAPGEPGGGVPWSARRQFEHGEAPPRMMMTPEERQQMREQIREAHRLRRERLEAERARRPD